MKKRFLSLLCVLALCLGLLPVTALADGVKAPDKLYVGDTLVSANTDVGYWTTNEEGKLEKSTEDGNWNVKYEPGSATLTLRNAKISGSYDSSNNPYTAGIYALCGSGQSVSLTIALIGENTIEGNYGILVEAQQADITGIDASLIIKSNSGSGSGSSSLKVTGSGNYGISVKSGTGDASLTIANASVAAKTTSTLSSYAGVYVHSGINASASPQLSLTVKGGSLTASSGSGNSKGIWFYVGHPNATGAATSLTVGENAIVDAKTGGISATQGTSQFDPTISTTGSNGDIVFDGTEGTVYGEVTLQDELTIESGETLTVPEGAKLDCNNKLTNNGTILVSGGTLSGGTALTTPTITTHPQDKEVQAGSTAEFSVTASIGESGDTDSLTYQWQQKTSDSSDWENISDATSATYSIGNTATTMSGYQYRCVVTAGGVGVISNTATLTVKEKPVTPTTYTISADVAPVGAGTAAADKTTAAAGATVTLTATPNSGYRFTGWTSVGGGSFADASSASTTFTMPAGAVTVTANFEQVYTVTVRASGSGTVTGGGSYTAGDTVTLTATPNSGYRFVRWEENGQTVSTSATYTFAASRDCALTAVFARNSGGGSSGGSTPTYSVSLPDRVTGGAVDVSPRNARKGTTVTLTATPDEGCELASLTVTDSKGNEIDLTDEGNGEYTFTMPASKVTIAAVFAEIEPLPAPLPFADVAEMAWYADAVRYAYENGLMNGTSAAAFDPDGTMDRAMLVTILYRQAGEPAVNYAMPFDDVAAGQWYSEAVRWAAGGGVVTGTGDTTFEPDAPVTREQFAVILYRYAQQSGADVSVGEDTNILSYTDAMDISEYAVPAMQWACGAGVMQGSGANLNPQGQATRAEAAAMLMRYLQR